MAKYLDDNGLLYFWQQLKTKFADKVDKESGKGLSTNDFTTALKNKLDGIAANAEVNVNADWNAASGDAQILNKPSIPSKTSDLTNDSNFAVDASYVHTDNNFTTTLKNKLDGIAAGAEVNVNADWNAASGDAQILNKPDIPSKTSDLTNDSNFVADASYVHTDNNFTDTDKGKADGALQKKSAAGIVYSAANATTTSAATASQIVSAIGNSAVNRATGDASGNNIANTYAPKASPALTGTPTAPTATAGTSNTQIATTAFVTDAIATAITGSASFQGTVDDQATIQNSNYKQGWYWVVSTAGTYVGQVCEAGDMIYAISAKGSTYSASDFNVVQANLSIVAITNAEIDTILAA